MKICMKHRHKTDSIVYKKVVNIGLKRNAEDFLNWLEPIFYTFKIDSKWCTNAEAVNIWKNLETELKDVDKSILKNLQWAIQASTGSLPFFSLPNGPLLLWKQSDLVKKESLLFSSTPVKYSCDVIP